MTDLEMTKLCAEAMGYTLLEINGNLVPVEHDGWDPFTNDAQAMALVRKMLLSIDVESARPVWRVCAVYGRNIPFCMFNADLNRAIVECVANMQQAKP